MREYGTKMNNLDEVLTLFQPVEGLNTCYYGKVRNGKTRTATADILELLKRGEVVYANWIINFEGFDERNDFGIVLVKTIFRNENFFVYKAQNFHYMSPDGLITGNGELNVEYLGRLVGVHIFIDEGQWLFSSMDRTFDDEMIAKMKLVLHGGHYCRSLNIITQRPSNISKNMRSQIHIWYRCVKRADIFGCIIFQRWEIEDMKDDLPVEFVGGNGDDKDKPLGKCKTYFCWKRTDKVFKAYNTHGMRADDAIPLIPAVDVYSVTGWVKIKMLLSALWPGKATEALPAQRQAQQQEQPVKLHVKHLGVDVEPLREA